MGTQRDTEGVAGVPVLLSVKFASLQPLGEGPAGRTHVTCKIGASGARNLP